MLENADFLLSAFAVADGSQLYGAVAFISLRLL